MSTLSDRMDFDHVIEVLPDGSIIDRHDLYAPEAYDPDPRSTELGTWTLLNGFSGQYSYSGPWMHDSEFIGGHLETRILSNPGVYVAVYASWSEDDTDGSYLEGWAVAFRES